MLNHPSRPQQRGFSLIVALIALVIMALAAISLMRTVSTSTLVSGNLAFEQAAVTGADLGIEAAIAWIENNSGQATSATAATCASGATVMACDQKAIGYLSTYMKQPSNQSWAYVWSTLTGNGAVPAAQGKDQAGNTASYLIERMCSSTGDASSANGCSSAPSSAYCGSSKSLDSNAGAGNLSCISPVYYRITVKVAGPRNTTTYIQAMVAL